MIPNISFHGVASVDLSPVNRYQRSDGKFFVSRSLVVRGHDRTEFVLELFADKGEDLRTDAERTIAALRDDLSETTTRAEAAEAELHELRREHEDILARARAGKLLSKRDHAVAEDPRA